MLAGPWPIVGATRGSLLLTHSWASGAGSASESGHKQPLSAVRSGGGVDAPRLISGSPRRTVKPDAGSVRGSVSVGLGAGLRP